MAFRRSLHWGSAPSDAVEAYRALYAPHSGLPSQSKRNAAVLSGLTKTAARGVLLKAFPETDASHWVAARLTIEDYSEALDIGGDFFYLPEQVAQIADAAKGIAAAPAPAPESAVSEEDLAAVRSEMGAGFSALRDAINALAFSAPSAPAPAPAAASSSFDPPEDLARLAPVVSALAKRGSRVVIGLTGPAGCGKSSAARWIAESTGRSFLKVDCVANIEASDFFGSVGLSSGSTEWQPAPFAEAVARPGTVILLDEANRMSPAVANGLLPLLDDQREAHAPGAPEPVRVADDVIFVLSLNLGAQYTGTERMDAALASRVTTWAEMRYLEAPSEARLIASRCGVSSAVAEALVGIASAVRALAGDASAMVPIAEEPVSTRGTIAAAEMVACGATFHDAVRATMVLPYSPAKVGAESPRSRVLAAVKKGAPAALREGFDV